MYTQLLITQPVNRIAKFFSIPAVKEFFNRALYLGTVLSLSIYIWIRLLFHDFPFEILEEIGLILRILVSGCAMTALCLGGFDLVIFIADNRTLVFKKVVLVKWRVAKSLAAVLLVGFLISCSGMAVSIKKDLNTGLVTTGKGMTTSSAKIIMNDEVLNHTDIPLGESFFIVNEGVTGLTVKDGKVSVGCSLVITDKKGEVLLSEPDLFKGNDLFDKDKAGYLRCIVNTGKPMEWEEKYNVSVVFTDKFGTGSVENKVAIKTIDIP